MLEEIIRSGRADRMFTGTTIKHLPQEKLRTIEFPVPSIERQDYLLQNLAELGSAESHLTSQLISARRRTTALRGALLRAAFTGRLTGFAHATELTEELAHV